MSDEISATDVYKAINGLRGEVREDQKAIWEEMKSLRDRDDEVAKCVSKNKLDLEKHNGRLHTHQTEISNLNVCADDITKHVGNDQIHFDKTKAMETKKQYLAKKELLLAVVILLTTIISGISTWIANGMPSLGP